MKTKEEKIKEIIEIAEKFSNVWQKVIHYGQIALEDQHLAKETMITGITVINQDTKRMNRLLELIKDM